MSNNKPKVAVIGLGNIGKIIAANLVKSERDVILASNKLDDASALANELGSFAKATDVASAIAEADIVVLSVWFSVTQALFKQHSAELQGKIIVDPSNPIAPDGNGGFKKIIGAQESAGEILNQLLPKGARLVKALGSLGAASLAGAAFQEPNRVLFYATDYNDLAPEIEELVRNVGFEAVSIGGIDQSIRMEVFGELHEFGALGRPVTKSELKEAV